MEGKKLWSFSRLKNFSTCKHAWKLKYIDGLEGDSNFFAQYGKIVHETIEKYAKGEITAFEVVDYYVSHFESDITMPAPYNKHTDLRESYFQKGLKYVESIAEYELKGFQILGVEEEVRFKLNGKHEFLGYIDLLLRNAETGDLVVIDHKSANIRVLKNGEVGKGSLESYRSYKRQMYLYSIAVYEKYGRYPTSYILNLFNTQSYITYQHDSNELRESIDWALDMIERIWKETEYAPSPDDYYCRYLCEYRNAACEYKR